MKWQIAVAAVLLAGAAQAAPAANGAPANTSSGSGDVSLQSPASPAPVAPRHLTHSSLGEDQRIAEEGRSVTAPERGTGSESEPSFHVDDGTVPFHR